MSTYGLELEGASAGRRLSREARIGIASVTAVVVIRIVGGNFVANDWEGWGTFVPNAMGAVVEGLILWGLVFGLLVRLGARSRGVALPSQPSSPAFSPSSRWRSLTPPRRRFWERERSPSALLQSIARSAAHRNG